jgi:hypothetical protein
VVQPPVSLLGLSWGGASGGWGVGELEIVEHDRAVVVGAPKVRMLLHARAIPLPLAWQREYD